MVTIEQARQALAEMDEASGRQATTAFHILQEFINQRRVMELLTTPQQLAKG